ECPNSTCKPRFSHPVSVNATLRQSQENPMTPRCLLAPVVMTFLIMMSASAWAEGAPPASPTAAAVPPTIVVELSNLRNDTGRVGCTLYNNEKGFPGEPKLALQELWCKID